jgi:hypothetical protein
VWAGWKGSEVATKQLEASKAALANELGALLVIARSGVLSTEEGHLRIYNGGRYAAIDVRLECLDDNDAPIGSGRTPLVAPATDTEVTVSLRSVERREAFGRCNKVRAEWVDGFGAHGQSLPVWSGY